MIVENVFVSIITIGDELMIGQVVDTNSAWIGRSLNKAGISIKRRVAVGDNWNDIWKALDEESIHSRIILITGGLGPTADDITKPLLCSYFNSKLVIHPPTLAHIERLFNTLFQRPMIERNIKQAEVPEICTVIKNERGTAPGMWFEKDNRIYVSMPGVPHEMQGMMTDAVIPMILQRITTGHIVHRTLLTAGIGESFLADHIAEWETALPEYLKLAYLPNLGMVRLRITGVGSDKTYLTESISSQFTLLKERVQEWLVADEDISLQQLVAGMLLKNKQTIGFAESCTGGYLSHLLTREAGASAIFSGAIISYANEVKKNLLAVNNATLDDHGAVSEQTVRQMAAGALMALKTDYAVATSGIMGPDGGSEEKPVGLVWIAVADKQQIVCRMHQFRYDRIRNIELTANHAFNLLRKFMLGQGQ